MGCCCCKKWEEDPNPPETTTIFVPGATATTTTATAPTLPSTAVTAPPQYLVHTPYAAGIYRPYTVYPTSAYAGHPAFTPYYQPQVVPTAPPLPRTSGSV